MTGAFAIWQPEYAARGVATFPVRDKKPAVSNYQKMRIPGSGQLARRADFANDDAFGIACGPSNLTVLDIDAPDERLLADEFGVYGESPFVVRTPSGGFHAWYRHGGERRQVRPDPEKPVDILGSGYVVAPPSRVTKGTYEIIAGSLDDLASLPTMRGSKIDGAVVEQVGKGHRANWLFRECLRAAYDCASSEALLDFAVERNLSMLCPPLPNAEVRKAANDAWRYEVQDKNWIGTSGKVVLDNKLIDTLGVENPDALLLYMHVKRHNYGRPTFFVANAMAEKVKMTRKKFAAARAELERLGLLQIVEKRTRHTPDTYSFEGGRN